MIDRHGNDYMRERIKEEFECDDKEAVELKDSFCNILKSCIFEGLPFSFDDLGVFVPGIRPGRTGTDPFGKPYKSDDSRSLVVKLHPKIKKK